MTIDMLPHYEATLEDCKNVYLPDEDTFLLIDTLTELAHELQPRSFIEIGPGSGVVSAHIFKSFPSIEEGHAVDLSPYAVSMTKRTAALNNVPLCVHEGSFFGPFGTWPSDHGPTQFDLIVFNPPYVPSSETDFSLGPLDLALAGGKDGVEVMLSFLTLLPTHLSANGYCFLVAIEANNITRLEEAGNSGNLFMKVMAEKRLRSEHLYVLCFYHGSHPPPKSKI